MICSPVSASAYDLLHDGAIALANVEANGFQIDVPYLKKQEAKIKKKIDKGKDRLKKSETWKLWRKKFGRNASIGSKDQMAAIYFGELGHKCEERTKTGKYKADRTAFLKIDDPFVKDYFEVEKLKKAHTTYIKGLMREVTDGFIHPFFNLNTAITYRSSSDKINFQNIPIHDTVIGKLIRDAFIPRPGRMLVEIDYSGLEFSIAGAITKDPAIDKYIREDGDPHRDLAALIYICKPSQVTKQMRSSAKNQFVFPLLYGSYYASSATALWKTVAAGLETHDGTPMVDHLAKHGISGLGRTGEKGRTTKGTFVDHVKQCEHQYTQIRFKKCFAEQQAAHTLYLKKGFVKFATGFCASGVMSRNNVYNYRIQGPAFHCLLWSLIELDKYLKKKGFKSLIVGQIHDSIVADVCVDELDDYVAAAEYIMTKKIRNAWDWISLPLSIEAEGCQPGETWNDKRVLAI